MNNRRYPSRIHPALALCLALGGACGRGGAGAPSAAVSASAAPRADGGAPSSSLPPIQATLHDETWKLALTLDPRAPKGALEIRGQPYALTEVGLVLEHEALAGSVARDGGTSPAHAARSYRLRFSLDECAHAPPTPPGAWPGPCGHAEGQPRPQKLTSYELLVDVESSYWLTGELHQIKAACVPRSGAGPSCKLEGTATALSD
jgi:hypothetical protein